MPSEHLWVREEWTRWYAHPICILLDYAYVSLSQIQTSKGEVIVTNDGATILKSIQALHPAAKMASSFKKINASDL